MANIAVPPTPQNVMTGPVEYKVYVYDNRPLLRIPPGHRFLTGIVRQRAILTSVLTDTEYDTADGGYALAYNGAIFGVLSSWKLCDYLDRYGFVYIECVWNQWYDFPHRFPLVVALGRELKNGADIGAVFHKTVSKHSPVIERLLNGIPEATLPAEVTALPVPKGSQAKPHVAITVGGETICEIGPVRQQSSSVRAVCDAGRGRTMCGYAARSRRCLMALTPMSAPARMPSALSVITIAST